jgi:hypothetical protein
VAKKKGPKRCVRCRLGTRYVFFKNSCFLHTNYFYLGCIYVVKARGGSGQAVMQKKGPNDASGVVWALGMYFLQNSCFLYTNYFYLGCIYVMKA